MPARFTPQCTISWHGVDDDTPEGYTVAHGVDAVGTGYTWLFEGPDATVEAFRGSIAHLTAARTVPIAYNRRGGLFRVAYDTADTLLRLSEAE